MPAGPNDHLVRSDDPDHPANLIPELCKKFYQLGWVTGKMLMAGLAVSNKIKALEEEPPSNRTDISTLHHLVYRKS